ncbi:histidine kinase [Roseateles noduli]|nr:histidine kinase [Roseateles noduli]
MVPSMPSKSSRPTTPAPAGDRDVVLLSGGNPQIPKGHGDAPVQAYIAALQDWKQAVVRRLDALIVEAVPDVRKAVKWNSPLYGVDGTTWFLGVHVMTRYVKVAFFNGKSLDPMPPVDSKTAHARYLHVDEKEPLDEAAFVAWVKAASAIPGEKM